MDCTCLFQRFILNPWKYTCYQRLLWGLGFCLLFTLEEPGMMTIHVTNVVCSRWRVVENRRAVVALHTYDLFLLLSVFFVLLEVLPNWGISAPRTDPIFILIFHVHCLSASYSLAGAGKESPISRWTKSWSCTWSIHTHKSLKSGSHIHCL